MPALPGCAPRLRSQALRHRNTRVFKEQILAPLRSRLGAVTHLGPLHSIGQRCRVCQQRHPCLLRRAVALALVARETSCTQVLRSGSPTSRTRDYMIDRQVKCSALPTAILAAVSVTRQNSRALGARSTLPSSHIDVLDQPNDARRGKRKVLRAKHTVAVELDNFSRALPDQANRARHVDHSQCFV